MANPRKILFRNASASLGQTIFSAAVYFLLYGFLIRELGPSLFGIWSIVLATTSATAVANLGVASSMVKFVSQYDARDDPGKVRDVILTGSSAVGLALAVALAATYPLWRHILRLLIHEPALLAAAYQILPYTILSFWISSLGGVFTSALDGCHRVDLRNYVTICSTLTFAISGVILSRSNGLFGLALAQLLQGAFTLIAGWVVLRHTARQLPILPFGGSLRTLKEIFSYSISFQAIAVTQLLFEPVTKALVLSFAGPDQLSYFEFARRMVTQFRSLIINTYQSIVPYISRLHELERARIRSVYHKALNLVLVLTLSTWAFLSILIPSISRLWLGSYQPFFAASASLLLAAWFTNVLSAPAYFNFVGEGTLRHNVISHFLTAVVAVVFGVGLGFALGPIGVVLGISLGIVVGSINTIVSYHRYSRTPFASFLDRSNVLLLGATAATGLIGLAFAQANPFTSVSLTVCLLLLSFAILMGPPILGHPVVTDIRKWVAELREAGR